MSIVLRGADWSGCRCRQLSATQANAAANPAASIQPKATPTPQVRSQAMRRTRFEKTCVVQANKTLDLELDSSDEE